ncbi:MAG: hypothetical protein M0Z28_10170, partial [Rhodospirillales bacterium]|nr:hypothetical protein [Rhodospirillales bacterium]
ACPAMNRPGLAGPLIILIWTRLKRIAQRVDRIAARLAAGTLHPPRRRAPRARRRSPAERPALPRNFGWLVRQVPAAAAGTCQLQALLADPAMEALIAAAPQIGRSLRPLCHMLGLRPPPVLRIPAPARPPAAGPAPLPAAARRRAPEGTARPADPPVPPSRSRPAPEVAARAGALPAPA